MRVCSYLWKFGCFHSHCRQRTWRQAFWVLWHVACCSQNTAAKAQQPIVTSHCLHVHLIRKLGMALQTCLCICIHVETQIGKLHWVELQRSATYLSKGWWRQRQAWSLPPFVWPTNHNGANYFLRTTRTWPCIFDVSAVDSNRETSCSVYASFWSSFSIKWVWMTHWLCFVRAYHSVYAVKGEWNVFWYEYTPLEQDEKYRLFCRFGFTCFFYMTYDNRQTHRVCVFSDARAGLQSHTAVGVFNVKAVILGWVRVPM